MAVGLVEYRELRQFQAMFETELSPEVLARVQQELAEHLARVEQEIAAQAFYGQLRMAPRLLTAEELRAAEIRARGEDRSLPRNAEEELIRAMARVSEARRRREVPKEELPDKPPALAPSDTKRLPMWVGPR